MPEDKNGQDNFVMEAGAQVPCDDYRPAHPVDQRCGYDNAKCPFEGDETKCGERN